MRRERGEAGTPPRTSATTPVAREGKAAERTLLVVTIATFLFAGGLRGFLSSVYYQNLAALELNATALYALLLLAPALFFIPALARRPGAMLLVGALGLAAGRIAQPLTRGGPLHLPLSGMAAAGFLLLLGALLLLARDARAPALVGIGLAAGWALDVALIWLGKSADPTSAPRGLLLVVPAAAALLVLVAGIPRDVPLRTPARTGWLAGAGIGAWLFVQNVIVGNPYAAARWNGGAPTLYAVCILAGLLAGAALLGVARSWSWRAVAALNTAALLAVLDHTFLHSPLAPGLLGVAQVALVLDAALLARALAHGSAGRALVAGGLVALVLHFIFAFTFLFDYVPLGHIWKGGEAILLPAALLLVAVPAMLAQRAPSRGSAPIPRRALVIAMLVPLLVAMAAGATPGARVEKPSGEHPLVLMTFNLHQGFANDGVLDPQVFLAVLDEEDPDIIVVQEGDSPRFTSGNLDVLGFLAAKRGYHLAYGQPTREQAFGGALLSRHPIEEWQAIPLPSDADNRFYTEARIDVGGQDVWIYAIHLTLPHADRMRETRAILAQAATREGPIILAGDFNSCPSGLCPDYDEGTPDDVYATMSATYRDAWAARGRDAEDPDAWTYDATDLYERIDYIFVGPGIEVVETRSVRTTAARAASDHLPVIAELHLG